MTELALRVVSETATTLTLGWTAPAGAGGYRFSREKSAGKFSHTWDGARSSARFSKDSAWYRVETLERGPAGDWPLVVPDPGGLLDRFPLPVPTGGTIGERGRILALSTPGQIVENRILLGHVSVRAAGVRFRRCQFLGPTGNVGNTQAGSNGEEIQVRVLPSAIDVVFEECEVVGNIWRAGLLLEGARVRVDGCHVHRIGGGAPGPPYDGERNLQHGVYWAQGGGLVEDSLIEDCRTYGVHFYPGPEAAVVRHSMIRRNGKTGVIFAERSRNCLVEDCGIGGNSQYGIEGWALDPNAGNAARANYVFGNGAGVLTGSSVAVSGTIPSAPPADW